MQEWSKVFKDAPQTPEDRAIWWVEYVIRNPTDTKKYLRSQSLELYWYQRLMLDVAAAVLLVLILVYKMLSCIFSFLLSLCCGRNKTVNKVKKS